ncbi:hypothetical protein EJB05_47628, partial [Eragrostis curvula]
MPPPPLVPAGGASPGAMVSGGGGGPGSDHRILRKHGGRRNLNGMGKDEIELEVGRDRFGGEEDQGRAGRRAAMASYNNGTASVGTALSSGMDDASDFEFCFMCPFMCRPNSTQVQRYIGFSKQKGDRPHCYVYCSNITVWKQAMQEASSEPNPCGGEDMRTNWDN